MRKLGSIFVIFLIICTPFTVISKDFHDKKVIIECFNGEKEETKEIPLRKATLIYKKVREIEKSDLKVKLVLIEELKKFLEEEDIISIPHYNLKLFNGENFSYNVFCFIYGTSRMLINILLRHIITQIIPQLFIISASIMPHILMAFSIYLSIDGEIETLGMLGKWKQEGVILGLMLGFVGIKLCLPPPFSLDKPYIIFGSCAAVLGIKLPITP